MSFLCSISFTNGATFTDGLKIGSTNIVGSSSDSAAIGHSNTSDMDSLAVGEGNSSSNDSFSVGIGNTSTWGSIVSGEINTMGSDSYNSIMVGSYNYFGLAADSAVFGSMNSAGNQYCSILAGVNNRMEFTYVKSGAGNVILGSGNIISALPAEAPDLIDTTVLLGSYNTASESEAWAFGKGNIAQEHTVTLGTYAQTEANAALIVGTGEGSGATPRKNALVVLKTGDVKVTGSITCAPGGDVPMFGE